MPRGITLVEMLVALAVLGLVLSVAALQPRFRPRESMSPAQEVIAAARREALALGRAVTREVPSDSADPVRLVTALPDGRVVAGPGVSVDFFTGVADAPR